MTNRYQHDFDEELGMYWYADKPSPPQPAVTRPTQVVSKPHARPRDQAYWDETGRLLIEYFELKVGVYASEALFEAFLGWLERSPAELRRFERGDDMKRAALVDWFLRVVR
jgi:hypothetical protein